MRLRLTPFKLPFIAGQLAVVAVMAKHAWLFREEWQVVMGSLSVALTAIGCALYILSDER